jgi:MFS family permease
MGAMSLRFSGPLTLRYGLRPTLVVSLAAIGIGLLLFARTPVDGNYFTDVLPGTLLLGFGAGLGFPGLMTLAMSDATPSDAGLASGLVNTSAQVGGAVGLAVLATLADSRTSGLLAAGTSAKEAINAGYHLAYLVGAGLVAVALLVVVYALHTRRAVTPAAEEPALVEAN